MDQGDPLTFKCYSCQKMLPAEKFYRSKPRMDPELRRSWSGYCKKCHCKKAKRWTGIREGWWPE